MHFLFISDFFIQLEKKLPKLLSFDTKLFLGEISSLEEMVQHTFLIWINFLNVRKYLSFDLNIFEGQPESNFKTSASASKPLKITGWKQVPHSTKFIQPLNPCFQNKFLQIGAHCNSRSRFPMQQSKLFSPHGSHNPAVKPTVLWNKPQNWKLPGYGGIWSLINNFAVKHPTKGTSLWCRTFEKKNNFRYDHHLHCPVFDILHTSNMRWEFYTSAF